MVRITTIYIPISATIYILIDITFFICIITTSNITTNDISKYNFLVLFASFILLWISILQSFDDKTKTVALRW